MFKNVKKEEITIPAQMSYLTQVRDFIEHIGKRYHFHDKVINSFKLVIDEACTNVIRHGYRDIKNGEITIKAIIRRLSLTIVIVDQGISYDPNQANTPDLANYVNIGKKGGLGILMMRKLMDNLQYTVTENGNEFRLTKNRENRHESMAVQYWNDLNLKTKYSIYAVLIFVILSLFVSVPMYLNLEDDIRNNAFSVAVGANLSLADNVIDDLLNENNAQLFEKTISVRDSRPDIIEEVFITDSTQSILAWANLSKSYSFSSYTLPEQFTALDSIGRVAVSSYVVSDTMSIYDLHTEVLLADVTPIGSIHVWINQQGIRDQANSKKLQLVIILVLILVAGIVALYFLIHKILAPFHYLAEWVRHVVRGKVDQDEIDIDASDEIGEIAQAFNEMTTKFRKAQVTLIEQQKLQKELQVAQEIQQMLLPSDFPKVEGYEIASYYEAAKEVGGDLFDFVEVDDDSIGIIVADVSGKGVPGSLIMTMIRTAVRLESRGNKNPADVLSRVNRFVANDMKRGMFVTMFYIILDSRNREIHFASAGHNPMILYRGSSKQTYYMNPSGFPVGIQLPDIDLFAKKIKTDSIRLREDDILVVYTDGITEAMNHNRELFREERFQESIRNNSHLDVGEFVKSINNELKQFTGGAPQNDDITYVAIKEKMMSGDVMYKVQEELFNLIDDGAKVKDALEQLRISPHQYYKYKEIIERKGMKGLKAFFDEKDLIEKKHMSIEQKTKVFDIITKHPDWGPKLISYELRTDTYGNEKIDADLIYSELVKLRLNTEPLRKRYLEKGGKTKRLKQPGTPLMTLDGKVILDFNSSEDEVAKRHDPSFQKHMDALRPTPEVQVSKPKISVHSSTTEPQPGASTFIHKPAETFKPKPLPEPEPIKEPVVKPEKPKVSEPKPAVTEPKQVKEDVKAPEPKPIAENLATKEDLLKKVSPKVQQDQISSFYENVQGDLDTVQDLIKKMPASKALDEDVRKITLILRIVCKHPNLRKLPEIRQVFVQILQIFTFIDTNKDTLKKPVILTNVKELLKYIENGNKFKDYSKLFESINKIGLIHRNLEQSLKAAQIASVNQLDQIRDKIMDKKIISDSALLESMAKERKK